MPAPYTTLVSGREPPAVAASPIHERFRSSMPDHQMGRPGPSGGAAAAGRGGPASSRPGSSTTAGGTLSSQVSVRSKVSVDTLTIPTSHAATRPNSWHGRGRSDSHGSASVGLPVVDEDEDYREDSALVPTSTVSQTPRDKASRLLGIRHERSMEPIPAISRPSMALSTRSVPAAPPLSPAQGNHPLCALYLVSGLPKSPQTWTLADIEATMGLHHSEGAVNRWWRPEVLGSTVSPGVGGGKKLRKKQSADLLKGAGALSKQDVSKMLSKGLKLSFTREVEIVASTLQPPSTVHSFTFNLPPSQNTYGASPSGDLLRNSTYTGGPSSLMAPYGDPYARPSSALLGPPPLPGTLSMPSSPIMAPSTPVVTLNSPSAPADSEEGTTYYGVCLTVWSHADAERTAAIRRALDGQTRARKESAHSLRAARLKVMRAQAGAGSSSVVPKRRQRRYSDAETDPEGGMETEADGGGISESEYGGDAASSVNGHAPGESTVFLPGDAVFWLPYALTLVSRFPVYDLMRDYLTLSWARFSKDVASHTLQIAKILAHPAPRAGDLVRLDASAPNDTATGNLSGLEVVARMPGALDFASQIMDTNVTMWPLFKALNADNILTALEIALAPTGRVLFLSRHPAMLGIAVSTFRYLLDLRGWTGLALPAVHCRDARIYVEDPGPWIIGMATEARYAVRPPPEVCVVDLDINYLVCTAPPAGVVSSKAQRDKYRTRILAAFGEHFHPDHSVPSEFKEAFPAGRFRPVCRVQAARGAAPAAVADQIPAPEWWHSTRIIQAFAEVLRSRSRPPSFLRRIASLGSPLRPPALSSAERAAQLTLRRRARAFVDAQDEMQSRIGRLSRRLNFLVGEADQWRDKFVAFEQHAERLANEASLLRAKASKEQRDARRRSAAADAEKLALMLRLREAEEAHERAVREVDDMRDQMAGMEEERALMIEEVEAQIERAIQSMAIGIDAPGDDLDLDSGEEGDRASRKTKSRKNSIASLKKLKNLHAFPLAADLPPLPTSPTSPENAADQVDNDKLKVDTKVNNKRFSVHASDPEDGLGAVDAGITHTSDSIAQKMMAIQQKLDNALSAEPVLPSSDSERSAEAEVEAARPVTNRSHGRRRGSTVTSTSPPSSLTTRTPRSRMSPDHPPVSERHRKVPSNTSSHRKRASVASTAASTVRSVNTSTTMTARPGSDADDSDDDTDRPRALARGLPRLATGHPNSPTRAEHDDGKGLNLVAPSPSTPALTPGVVGSTTDDSDAESQDYQSAYSMSPRTSRRSH